MVHCFRNIKFPSNTYILSNESNNTCLIIDPGLDEDALYKRIQELNLSPLAIIATHGHFDHIAGVPFLKTKYDIPFYLHEADLKMSKSVNFFLKMGGIDHTVSAVKVDHLLRGKHDSIVIRDFHLDVYNLPGHSPGSCVIRYGNELFSGDLIYKKGTGFNNFPGEDKFMLRVSIKEIFELFPGDIRIFPGHGESERLGVIKSNNKELAKFLE